VLSHIFVVLALFLVELPACASRADRIEVRLVVGDEAKAQHREDELDLFAPRFTSCEDCVQVTFTPPSGGTYSVEAEREPRLVLSSSDVKEVRLTETRSVLDPSVHSWVAIAIPTEEARYRMAEVTAKFPFDSVLVAVDGVDLDVHSTATWSAGIRLGVFRDRADLEKFADKLTLPKAWIPFDEKEFQRARQEVRDALEHGYPFVR
jgi:hypothetical protein